MRSCTPWCVFSAMAFALCGIACLKDIPPPVPEDHDVSLGDQMAPRGGAAGGAAGSAGGGQSGLSADAHADDAAARKDSGIAVSADAGDEDARATNATNTDGPTRDGTSANAADSKVVNPPVGCTSPMVGCGGKCVDQMKDRANCGTCDNVCGTGICSAGRCSCSNGARDNDELGVDCGGSCAACGAGALCDNQGNCPVGSGLTCISDHCLSANKLVAYYDLEQAGGTIRDASGQGNDGFVEGATRVTAKVKMGYRFDSAGCIRVPNSKALSLANGSMLTMMAWVKQQGRCNSDRGTILDKGDTYKMGLNCSDASMEELLQLPPGPVRWQGMGTGSLGINEWHHVTITWDGVTVRHYIDGKEVGHRAQAGTFGPALTGLGIGCSGITAQGVQNPVIASQPFNGTIDEVVIYARALAAGDVATYVALTR